MTEIWVSIPDFNGYDVSSLGRIRSWRPWRGQPVPRVLKPTPDDRGYLCTRLYGQGDGKYGAGAGRTIKVHWLVTAAFVGPKPEGMVVRHLDGDHANNRIGNLLYGTPEENIADSVRHKTHCKQGHAFSPENTFQRKSGRGCRECRRQSWVRFKERGAA